MCCNSLFGCLLFLLLSILVGLSSLKVANSRIHCEINNEPIIFSITITPMTSFPSSWYYLIHSQESFDIFNIRFMHIVYTKGGGQISILWIKNC